jgi:ABC-type Fe3+ transport system permease subunit
MSEHELAKAMQSLIVQEGPVLPDARQLAREIVDRDRRWARWLACFSVFFSLLGVAGLVLLVIGLGRFLGFMYDPGQTRSTAEAEAEWLQGTGILHHSIPLVGGALVALFLGAVCTVLLVFTSRRATMQQIHVSLLEMSEQLKEVRQKARMKEPPQPEGGEAPVKE